MLSSLFGVETLVEIGLALVVLTLTRKRWMPPPRRASIAPRLEPSAALSPEPDRALSLESSPESSPAPSSETDPILELGAINIAVHAATEAALRLECQRLQVELQLARQTSVETVQQAVFQQLQPLLTSYPSACKMALARPELPAKNLVALLTPLETLMADWEYMPIGPVWAHIPFDPQRHQPDIADIQPGELVYIRFVGYQQGAVILCPAKVSRTLPIGISPEASNAPDTVS
jgi:hypothetical protein